MWFPIMMFAICGFEHAIANMAFIPLGLMVGADESVDYRKWLYQNLILVILGNIVGGGLIVGGAEYFLFNWTKVLRTVQDKQTDHLRSNGQATDVTAGGTTSVPSLGLRSSADSLDMERVRQVFATFDADRDGAVNAQELMCALSALGFRYPLQLLQSMLTVAVEGSTVAVEGARTDVVLAEDFEGLARRLCELEGLGLREAVA
jgi:hypothetical protein